MPEPVPPIGDDVPRFIAGMPRAATAWLSRSLNGHPRAVVFGESLFFGRGWIEPGEGGSYNAEQLARITARLRKTWFGTTVGTGPGYCANVTRERLPGLIDGAFAGLAAPATPRAAFDALASMFRREERKPIAIEKTPQHVVWIERLFAAYPGTRVVVMTREPYGFMLSYKHQGDRMKPPANINFRKRYHPAACALLWQNYARACRDAERRYPGQVLLVDNERLRDDPGPALVEIQRFLGLEPVDLSSGAPPENSSFPKGDRPSLRAEDVFWMNRIGRAELKLAGVTPRATPWAPLRIAWSILRFPYWLVWSYRHARARVAGSMASYAARMAGGERGA